MGLSGNNMDINQHRQSATHSRRSFSTLSLPIYLQTGVWAVLLMASAIAVIFTLAACGPGASSRDEGQLKARTVEIAQAFQTDGDLTKARDAVDALEVANPRQWLIMLAEQSINEQADPATVAGFVKLTEALNIQSAQVRSYAEKNGLAAPTPAVQIVAAAPIAPTLPAMAAQAAPAAAPPADTTQASTPLETPTAALPTATPGSAAAATPTPAAAPQVQAGSIINVRSGPGTDYGAVAALDSGEAAAIVAKNATGDWWQISLSNGAVGWVFGELVNTSGELGSVPVESNIPTAPTAAPAVEPQPTTATEADAPTESPTAAATEAATPQPDPSDQPFYKLVSRRMWSKEENGGCIGQHLLRINVVDANGVRVNGVALKGIYTGEVFVTGSQGKGDGVIEYDLFGSGEGFRVMRNDDGRDANSDNAEGFTTRSMDIPKDVLIAGGYCADSADCDVFFSSFGCKGHHSWEATFQRNY